MYLRSERIQTESDCLRIYSKRGNCVAWFRIVLILCLEFDVVILRANQLFIAKLDATHSI